MIAVKRLTVAIFAVVMFLSAEMCNAQDAVAPAESESQCRLNEQNVMGFVWMRRSGEYRALCYQAYNAALKAVEDAVENYDEDSKPPAFILDCDETILDTTEFNGSFVGTAESYSTEKFNKWIKENREVAIPGAVNLLNKIDELGVNIFYISNRSVDVQEESQRNLLGLGFPQVDSEHVLLKEKGDNTKIARRAAIEEKYNVIVYMGDSMTDFPLALEGKNYKEILQVTDLHSDEFGTKYIILPNPVYGSWEVSLTPGYRKLSPEEKERVRKECLK